MICFCFILYLHPSPYISSADSQSPTLAAIVRSGNKQKLCAHRAEQRHKIYPTVSKIICCTRRRTSSTLQKKSFAPPSLHFRPCIRPCAPLTSVKTCHAPTAAGPSTVIFTDGQPVPPLRPFREESCGPTTREKRGNSRTVDIHLVREFACPIPK